MATIAEIGVNIVANTRKLEAGVKRSRVALRGLAAPFRNVSKAMGSWVGAAVGIFSVAAALSKVKEQLQEIDKLGKTSAKLGIDPNALQGLRIAADRTGVGQNTLDTGLQRMIRRLSDAANGTGTAVKALDELNISAEKIAQLAPDEQFKLIADAMNKVKSEGDKVRLTFALFDSEGVALKNTLALGSDEIERFTRENRKMITNEQIGQVESLNDAVSDLGDSWDGLWQTITTKVAPSLNNLASEWDALLQSGFDQRNASAIATERLSRQNGIHFEQLHNLRTGGGDKATGLAAVAAPRAGTSAALALSGVNQSIQMAIQGAKLQTAQQEAISSLTPSGAGVGGGFNSNGLADQGSREEFALEARRRQETRERELEKLQREQLATQIKSATSLDQIEKILANPDVIEL